MKKPILSNNSINYTINHLFKIANPKGNLIFNIRIDDNKKEATINFNQSHKKIVFNLVDDCEWHNLAAGNYQKLRWIQNSRNTYKVPVLFWNRDTLPFVSINNNEAIFNGDIVSSSLFMLSRWEEKNCQDLDIHGRFKYKNSVAFKEGFITIPIVDEYALILRKVLYMLFPNVDLGKNHFKIKISHDIDNIRRFKNLAHSFRSLGGDLLKTKSIDLAVKSLSEYKNSYKYPEKDPYFLAIFELAQISLDYEIDGAFYFQTSDKSDYDSGYAMDNYIIKCIEFLQDRGFEIGFHPGYYTFNNYQKFMEEKNKLDKILGYKKFGGRQHYLRFDVNTTWQYWEKARLKYDSTLGYAEQEGFRCGTSHPFRPFDLDEDREIDIIEVPLIAMDGTIKTYRGLSPETGLNSLLDLKNKCEEVEGIFTLLWHNTSVYRNHWDEWIEKVYKEILQRA